MFKVGEILFLDDMSIATQAGSKTGIWYAWQQKILAVDFRDLWEGRNFV